MAGASHGENSIHIFTLERHIEHNSRSKIKTLKITLKMDSFYGVVLVGDHPLTNQTAGWNLSATE